MSVLKMNYFFAENDTASSLPGDKIEFWREKVITLLILTETSRQHFLNAEVLGMSLSYRDRSMPAFWAFCGLKLAVPCMVVLFPTF